MSMRPSGLTIALTLLPVHCCHFQVAPPFEVSSPKIQGDVTLKEKGLSLTTVPVMLRDSFGATWLGLRQVPEPQVLLPVPAFYYLSLL